MTLPGFLFDMDGVLVESGELHWQAWQQLKEERPELKIDRHFFINNFGKTNDLILQELLPKSSKEERKSLGEYKESLFRKIGKGKIELIEGMEDFLQEVVKSGHPHIIASSTPLINLKFYLKETVLGKYFQQYTSAEEVAKGKPHPDVFIEAAKRLNLPSEDCVVLEDSLAGLKAGRDSKSFVIALQTTHHLEDLRNYDLTFTSPKTLDLKEIRTQWSQWRHGAP